MWHIQCRAWHLLVLAWLWTGCTSTPPQAPTPHLPAGEAGAILARALDAAGGWDRWMALRDIGYVNTFTILDPFGNVTSESIGWYMAPLHAGLHARMDSIGLASEVTLGIADDDTWGVRNAEPIREPPRLELARFSLVSNLFWFSLPFAVAEMPATVTDLGDTAGESGAHWHRLKVVFDAPNPAVPGEWFVLYINTQSGLIDRIHARLIASFLNHDLWIGKWLDYHDWNGLKKERQRKFFPADADGQIVGNLVAEQLVEHVRVNNGYTPEHFRKPAHAAGAQPARGAARQRSLLQHIATHACSPAPAPLGSTQP